MPRTAPKAERALRFLLSGYYGFGNLGDEALLELIAGGLRERYPKASIEVLSADPPATERDFRVEASPRADPANLRRAIGRADVVISGGGGLLQNTTSLRSLIYYGGIIRSAIKAGRKTMIFAQSIGPLDFIGKQTVRECCRGLGAATVRDERSRALLGPLLSVAVERTADPVFLYDGPHDAGTALNGIGGDGTPLAVVSVRTMPKFAEVVPRIAAAVDRLAALGVRVAFVPFSEPSDGDASTQIIQKCASKPMLLPARGLREVATVFSRASLVLGIRLHALILAARLGVPFLAVPYDPKVTGLCEDLRYPLGPLWSSERQRAADPAALVDEAWARRDELAAGLRAALPAIQAAARRNFDVLDRLVGS
jgi:polysaccharide pyruvyl transferase CsaB